MVADIEQLTRNLSQLLGLGRLLFGHDLLRGPCRPVLVLFALLRLLRLAENPLSLLKTSVALLEFISEVLQTLDKSGLEKVHYDLMLEN